jgi:hypothetical protein
MQGELSPLVRANWRQELIERGAAQREESARTRFFWWIVALLCAIIFEGGFRKWVLPTQYAPIAYVAKDIIGLAFVFTHPIPPRFRYACRARVLMWTIGIVLLYPLLIGLGQSPAAAILKYKNAVLWPLIALHMAANMDSKTFDRLIRILSPVTVGMALLGVMQYGSSPSAFVNKYAWTVMDNESAITFGGATGVRATGTFSFIAGMSTYAVAIFGLLLWRLLVSKIALERKLITVGMAAAVVCGLTTGSRYIVFGMGLSTGLTLLASRNFKTLLRLTVAGMLLGVVLWLGSGAGFLAAFVDRWQNAGDSMSDRLTGSSVKADYGEYLGEEPFGVGLGQASQLARQNGGTAAGFDHPVSNLIVESGYLGVIGLGLMAMAAFTMLRDGFFSRDAIFRLGVYAVGMVPLYTLLNDAWRDHVATALNWFVVGLWFSSNPAFRPVETEAPPVDETLPEGVGAAPEWR